MRRASSLLSTSTMSHALCSPSMHPQSVCVTKWEPVFRKISTTRAHATVSSSCGTSMRNLAMAHNLLTPDSLPVWRFPVSGRASLPHHVPVVDVLVHVARSPDILHQVPSFRLQCAMFPFQDIERSCLVVNGVERRDEVVLP